MVQLHENIQKHKSIYWIVVLGYIVFNGCFGFPFSNELFPFTYSKGLMIAASYGIIGLLFEGLLDKGRQAVVLVATLFFSIIGLICRYILEFGEVSNTMNFIPINIALYLIIIPIYCTLIYWSLYKLTTK